MNTSENRETVVSKFINKRILETGKSQRDIAREAGFNKPNMISMLKTGESKLPLDRVPGMAKALECDIGYLFRLALTQYFDAKIVAGLMQDLQFTPNETEIIHHIRHVSGGTDPKMTSDIQSSLSEIFSQK